MLGSRIFLNICSSSDLAVDRRNGPIEAKVASIKSKKPSPVHCPTTLRRKKECRFVMTGKPWSLTAFYWSIKDLACVTFPWTFVFIEGAL